MAQDPLFDRRALDQIIELLERQFGPYCEVVLHNLSRPYDHTIVDIRNGHITGRVIGDSGTNLGLEIIRGTAKQGDKFNYITRTRDGKVLRSSSIYLRTTEGNLFALCVNMDITEPMRFESYLRDVNRVEGDGGSEEVFVNNVGELLEYFLQKGQELVGREPAAMNKEEKMRLLEFLDRKGAFLISKSGKRICEALGISKFTLYNYLETIRKNSGNGNGKSAGLDIAFED
jgi:predicted transcriptional regulator YheO